MNFELELAVTAVVLELAVLSWLVYLFADRDDDEFFVWFVYFEVADGGFDTDVAALLCVVELVVVDLDWLSFGACLNVIDVLGFVLSTF